METLLHVGLSNALTAAALALVAAAVGSVCRRPALVHGLWLLVLLKLVTPPLVPVRIPWPDTREAAALSPPQQRVFAYHEVHGFPSGWLASKDRSLPPCAGCPRVPVEALHAPPTSAAAPRLV